MTRRKYVAEDAADALQLAVACSDVLIRLLRLVELMDIHDERLYDEIHALRHLLPQEATEEFDERRTLEQIEDREFPK